MADSNTRGALLLVGGLAIIIGVVVLINIFGERTTPDVSGEGLPQRGTAAFEIFLFEDYQCSHCRDYELSATKQDLIDRWVAPGEVTLVYKFVDFIGDDSTDAAYASQCVWELQPGRWHDWHRLMFQSQQQPQSGWASAEQVHARTSAWDGVDMDEFSACTRDTGRLRAIIDANSDDMANSGIRGTPGLLVGDRTPNPGDPAAVNAAIEAALSGQGTTDGPGSGDDNDANTTAQNGTTTMQARARGR